MTRFLDVRIAPVGGNLATLVAVNQGTSLSDYAGLGLAQLQTDCQGRHLLIGVHGFDVDRAAGIEHLSNWEGLLQLAPPSLFIGLLWPGDSVWAHGLDYPEEPKVADEAGELIAPFLDANLSGAASISFASHSLGARVVLQTVSAMSRPVRRVIVMAGAIDDDCLNKEYQETVGKVAQISVLASAKDKVLSTLFPLGNLIGGVIAKGHPWWHAALGHHGPANPTPGNLRAPFEIASDWKYGHHDYLQVDPPPSVVVPIPTDVPPEGTDLPAGGSQGWQEAWSAALCSSRFR